MKRNNEYDNYFNGNVSHCNKRDVLNETFVIVDDADFCTSIIACKRWIIIVCLLLFFFFSLKEINIRLPQLVKIHHSLYTAD